MLSIKWIVLGLTSLGVITVIPALSGISKKVIKKLVKDSVNRTLTDDYQDNLWGLVSNITRLTPQVLIETHLRAEKPKLLKRTMGTYKYYGWFDKIIFNVAQLDTLPTSVETKPDIRVTLGERAKRPLSLDIPIMVGGMAFGSALSEETKISLAKGTAAVGTATNTGYGAYLKAERDAAKYLIVQYNKGHWAKNPEIFKHADMIELTLGQGSYGGIGHKIPSNKLDRRLREGLIIPPNQDGLVPSRYPEMEIGQDLEKVVTKVRSLAPDIPISAKMAGSKYIEKDIDIAVDAGIDVIAIDGSEGGTKDAPPITQDSFGLPTLHALTRAVKHLRLKRKIFDVDLIISGGIFTPADMLKALALGADAIYIGTVALIAVSHKQIVKTLPFEPPAQLLWYDTKLKSQFNIEEGARSLENFFRSCCLELEEGIKVLGKTKLAEVSRDDMMALDNITADITGLPLAHKQYDKSSHLFSHITKE